MGWSRRGFLRSLLQALVLLVGVKRLQTFAKNLRRLSFASAMAGSSIGRTTDFESVGWRFEPSPASQSHPKRVMLEQCREDQWLVTLHGVTGVGNVHDRCLGLTSHELGLVLVVDDGTGSHRAYQRDRHRQLTELLPEVAGRRRLEFGLPVLLVTPDPRAVGALYRVVQDAASK